MTEKAEEIIIEQLFKLSDKIDNLHTEMNIRFEKQDKKMDKQKEDLENKIYEQRVYLENKMDKQKEELEDKIDEQRVYLENKMDKQNEELESKIEEQGKNICKRLEMDERDIRIMIQHTYEFSAKERAAMEKRIIEKIDEKVGELLDEKIKRLKAM